MEASFHGLRFLTRPLKKQFLHNIFFNTKDISECKEKFVQMDFIW